MDKPIIDPSQLTEEQKRIVRKRYSQYSDVHFREYRNKDYISASITKSHMVELCEVFGEDMFKTKDKE